MANHLIIGLGGTGEGVLRELRKRVYEEYQTNEPDGNTRVKYIYLDSDADALANANDSVSQHASNESSNGNAREESAKEWRYLGKSVKLPPASLVNIHGMGAGVLDNLNAFPGIKAFVSQEDRELLRDRQVNDIITTGIGGQRRRFGRMLFANNLANASQEKKFTEVLARHIAALTSQGDGRVNIHIVAGLAGGTGSGTIVDVITQIIKATDGHVDGNGETNFPMCLYLYVPELTPPLGHDVQGFYQANGYAALKELNALSIGKYKPLDVSPMNITSNGDLWRLDNKAGEPFKKAYLYTDHNSENRVLPKGAKLSAAVADFIYQKMLGSGSAMKRLENAENVGCQPDNNEDGCPVHSRNFMTFGIKRVLYPEHDIRGYIGYSSSVSMVNHLLCNKWVDHAGFQMSNDETEGLGIDTEIKKPATREGYMISDAHLTLQSEIKGFEDTKNWKSAKDYWLATSSRFVKMTVENEKNNTLWKNSYLQKMELTYEKNFRNLGVRSFYDQQKRPENVKRFSKAIANHIETTLFNEWNVGIHGDQPQSLQKIKIIFEATRNDCLERIPKVDKLVADIARRLAQDVNPKVEQAAKELDNVGGLRDMMFNSRSRLLNEFAEIKKESYIIRTNIEAYGFEKLLLEELAHELTGRIEGLSNLIRLLRLAGDKMAAATEILSASSSNVPGEVNVVERIFDPDDMISKTNEYIIRDSALQQEIAKKLRDKLRDLVDQSGGGRYFGNLYNVLGGAACFNFVPSDDQETPENAMEVIRSTIFQDISEKLDRMADDDPSSQFLKVNVLQKIRQEYPTDEALRGYIGKLVATARPFANMSTNSGAIVGTAENAHYRQFVQLCIPDYSDKEFRQKFVKLFADAVSWSPGEIDDNVSVNKNENELVIITGTSNLPIRMIHNVSKLKEKYEMLTSGAANVNSALNKVLLHTESLGSDLLPDLYAEDPKVRARKIRGYAMCIHAQPNLIQQQEDVNTGKIVNVIISGEGLRKTSTRVGADMEETARMMEDDHDIRNKLIKIVDERILPNYRRDDERQKMSEAIEDKVIEEILNGRCKNNPTHPMFETYRDAAESFIEANLKN